MQASLPRFRFKDNKSLFLPWFQNPCEANSVSGPFGVGKTKYLSSTRDNRLVFPPPLKIATPKELNSASKDCWDLDHLRAIETG